MRARKAAMMLQSLLCDASLWNTHDSHVTPATPQQAALTAGRAAQTVTDVGTRHAAKCPSLRVQSWMLISISSITCSNTDLSHSRASSLAAFYLLCTLPQLPLAGQGQNVWCLCGSRWWWVLGCVGQDILALACQALLVIRRWSKGPGGVGLMM